jgi:hypothetical protein
VAFRDYCSLFALGLSLAACKGGEHTTDPAGVIQLDEPITVIGGGAERDGHLLYRVAGAILDQEGNLLIADGGSGELRVFGTDGELLKRLGGLEYGRRIQTRFSHTTPVVRDYQYGQRAAALCSGSRFAGGYRSPEWQTMVL